MKVCLKIFFLLFIGLMNFCYGQPLNDSILQHIKNSVVYIRLTHEFPLVSKELQTSGTGFFISKSGYILTCYHVIEPVIQSKGVPFPTIVRKIEIISHSGTARYKKYEARVINVDKTNDIALLLITDSINHSYIEIDSSRKLTESAPIWSFGFPMSDEFSIIQRGPEVTVTQGFITALRHNDESVLQKIQYDAVVKSGNSGSPLINASGKAIGIVNLAFGDTRFNYAVPAHFVSRLVNTINLADNYPDKCSVSFTSDPPNANVYINNRFAGKTPLSDYKIDYGYHEITIIQNGYEIWRTNRMISKNETFHAGLVPHRKLKVENITPNTLFHAIPVKYEVTSPLLSEDFNSEERFRTWKQNTGGGSQRTWFLENNALHQYESDNLLHAISLGESHWSNYLVTSNVRITDKHDDSRAGILFNETSEGFYVLRIHKESQKAQLAYHSKKPFGWFIITEKKLETEITNEKFRLTILSAGDIICCWFNELCLFTVPAVYSQSGNIGFYSVESKASFDSLRVMKIKLTDSPKEMHSRQSSLIHYWFTDNFDMNSTWWSFYADNPENPQPWLASEGGTAQFIADNITRVAELCKYRLMNCDMQLIATLDKAQPGTVFEIFLRNNSGNRISIRFVSNEKTVELCSTSGNKTSVLKKAPLPEDFFNGSVIIRIVLNGKKIRVDVMNKTVLEFKNLKEDFGTLGFSTTKLRVVLHHLTVSAARNE